MKKKRSNLTGIIISMLLVFMMVFISACNFGNNSSNNNNNEQVLAVEAQNGQDDVLDSQDVNVEEERDGTSAASVAVDFSNAKVGDIVIFGEYEQDGIESNGNEPIEWEVLEVSENRALIISKYVLDCKPYNEEVVEVTWETCSLRAWLNGEFYNTAFDDNERKRINEVTLLNLDNSKYGTNGGNDTDDRIFLLSQDEILKYYGDDWYDTDDKYGYCDRLIIPPTQMAIDSGLICDDNSRSYWWLRSPGSDSDMADSVTSDGGMGWSTVVNSDLYGVRPALYVEF